MGRKLDCMVYLKFSCLGLEVIDLFMNKIRWLLWTSENRGDSLDLEEKLKICLQILLDRHKLTRRKNIICSRTCPVFLQNYMLL